VIVFSNTTPFIALSSIQQLDLLPELFKEVYIVDSVIEECATGGKIIVPDLTKLTWVRIVKIEPEISSIPFLIQLDKGEQETIQVALREKADYVIMDEKMGRNIAEYLGLAVIGSLGILLKAKQVGKITSFVSCVKAMQAQGIYYNTKLLEKLAKQVGETF